MLTTTIKIRQVFTKNNHFNWIRQLLVTALLPSTDPKVHWKRNLQDNLYLEIYDPMTAEHHYFESEQEARIWIEKRHHI